MTHRRPWAYQRTALARTIARWMDFAVTFTEADALTTEDIPSEDDLQAVLIRFDRMGERLVAARMLTCPA